MLDAIKRTLFLASGGNLKTYYGLRRRLVRIATLAGFYDKKELKYLKTLIRPGDHILDVGANLGAYTLHFARWVQKTGTVTAFEPYPEIADELEIQLRGAPWILIRREALSSKDSIGTLHTPFLNHGVPEPSLASLERTPVDRNKTITVSQRNLDSIIRELPRPIRLIKIDVEGHEVEILKGGNELITKDRPFILIEFALLTSAAKAELNEFIHRHRYSLELIHSNGRELVSPPKGLDLISDTNVLLVPNQ